MKHEISEKDLQKLNKTYRRIVKLHKKAYLLLNEITDDRKKPWTPVSKTVDLLWYGLAQSDDEIRAILKRITKNDCT